MSAERLRREKAEVELDELKDLCGNYMPIIITDVEIANVYNDGSIETDFGGIINSGSSMYVKPKIKYEGIKGDEDITIEIRLYTPSGLSRSNSSPSDCSWTESFHFESGSNTQILQGWGGDSMGHWMSGMYRFEFWLGNICLYAKTFRIY